MQIYFKKNVNWNILLMFLINFFIEWIGVYPFNRKEKRTFPLGQMIRIFYQQSLDCSQFNHQTRTQPKKFLRRCSSFILHVISSRRKWAKLQQKRLREIHNTSLALVSSGVSVQTASLSSEIIAFNRVNPDNGEYSCD